MKAIKRGVLVMVLLFMAVNTGQAQNYKIKAVFLYTFIRYIQWPPTYQEGDFIIGVVGNSEMVRELESMAQKKKAGSRKIVIKKFNAPGDISKCNMLFLPKERSAQLQQVIQGSDGIATLIVTEKDGMAKAGSGINFILKDGKPKFELNKGAIEKKNLRVANELLSLAIII